MAEMEIKVYHETSGIINQCDLFKNVEFLEYVQEEGDVITVSKIVFPLAIVLTQACDLQQDYNARKRNKEQHTGDQDKFLISVIVAPVYNFEDLRLGNHLEQLGLTMQIMGNRLKSKCDNIIKNAALKKQIPSVESDYMDDSEISPAKQDEASVKPKSSTPMKNESRTAVRTSLFSSITKRFKYIRGLFRIVRKKQKNTTAVDPVMPPSCTADDFTEESSAANCGATRKEQERVHREGLTLVVEKGTRPTCTKLGYTDTIRCSVCGKITSPPVMIPPLGHQYVVDNAVPATETEEGLTEGSHCTVCGFVFIPQNKIGFDFIDDGFHQVLKVFCLFPQFHEFFHLTGDAVVRLTHFLFSLLLFGEGFVSFILTVVIIH